MYYQSTSLKFSIYRPPWLNDRTRFWSYTDTNPVGIGSRVVFGLSKPPDEYEFAFVPRNAEVSSLEDHLPISTNILATCLNCLQSCLSRLQSIFAPSTAPSTPAPSAPAPSTPKLSSSLNLVKGMVALLQLLYTVFTLIHANDGQVKQYGFVAPGLTVLPYAIMSGLNLIAGLVAPNYPTLYLVRSKVMEEAERRTGLPFNYVVGKVVDESDTNNDVMEGWSEIVGSFEDDDKLLYITSSAEKDKKIEISDGSSQDIYVPACPRFQRTDDTWTSPLRQFNKTPQDELEFPRYVARFQQDLTPPSLFSRFLLWLPLILPSLLSALLTLARPLLRLVTPLFTSLLTSTSSLFRPVTSRLTPRLTSQVRPRPPRLLEPALNKYELFLVAFIIGTEVLIALALSNFSRQQSTVAQRAWIVTWLIAGYFFGAMIYDELSVTQSRSRKMICLFIVSYSAPAIGGLVVVSQMLKAYGICHRFV